MSLRSWISGKFASGDRSPWGSFWFEPIGVRTSSGLHVTADNSMQLSAVYACVRIIASQFASLPFVLYSQRPDGGKDLITDHPVYRLLAKRPNQYQNAFEWREMMAGHIALRGNAFNQIVSNGKGEITSLIPLHPDRVKILINSTGNYSYQYTDIAGSQQMFARGEIWHIRGLSSDGFVGLSVIALARNSVGGALAAQDYGSRFFANDAKPTGGWIEYPGSFKDKQAREQVRESIQEAQGGSNKGKIAIYEFGMKYHELGVSNEDSQFLQTRQFQVNDIARWFGVPPHKIASLEFATNNNIEQQALEFIQDCLGPMAERWEASIESELLFDDENLMTEFKFSQLLRGDSSARSAFYNQGIFSGWLTRNEVRISENRNPLPGLDAPLLPMNMSEEAAGALLTKPTKKLPAAAAAPAPKDNATENPAPEIVAETIAPASHERLAAMAGAAADRIARKEVEMVQKARAQADKNAALLEAYAKHGTFVANAMAISEGAATAYCVEQIEIAADSGLDFGLFALSTRTKLEKLAKTAA